MLRLKRFYTPYWFNILLAALLVVAVAWSNLALPDYLSKIVNTGIQKNGVESSLPVAMRQSTMDRLVTMMPAEDQAEVLDHYSLVEPGSTSAANLIKTYPVLSDQAVYVLKEISKAEKDAIEEKLAKPMIVVEALNLIQEDSEKAKQVLGENFPFKFDQLTQGTDIMQMLETLPKDQRQALRDSISGHLNQLEGTILNQMSISAVVDEYKAMGMDIVKFQSNYILKIGTVMIGVSIVAVISSILVSFFAARTSTAVARDMRSAIFKKVESFSSAEFGDFSTASLITRTTNDVAQVQMVSFMLIRMAFQAPLIGILGVINAFDKSPSMWWTIALAVVILVLLVALIFALVTPRFKRMQLLIDRLNLIMRENLSGMLVIRAFNKQRFEESRFDDANIDVAKNMRGIGRTMSFIMPLMTLVMSGAQVLIIWVGAHQVAQSSMQVGDLMAFMQYAMQILMAFLNLSMLFVILPRATVSGERIADVLDRENVILDPVEPLSFPVPTQGVIEFHDVDFRYPGAEEDVLHDISFRAEPGQVTAVIGSTGSGKSTLINLLPRLFDVTKGKITLDGVDIRDVTQHELRENISYAPQRGMLFSGTVKSNLLVGNHEASEDKMQTAVEVAQASDFVFSSESGLDTEVAQAGINLSGGQKQRLSIARAIIKDSPVYIFDDSFSALDFKTDAALRKAIRPRIADKTVFVVTQRVSTARNSDQILVLENGRLVGLGHHDDLIKTCQTYQEIAQSQLSEEELA
jgi:ATP-binding cassette subfamily B protein